MSRTPVSLAARCGRSLLVVGMVAAIVATSSPAANAHVPGRIAVAQPIPAGAPAATEGPMIPVQVEIRDAGTITDIDVAIRANHTFDADLDIYLRHPDGTEVELSTDNGTGDDFGSGRTDCLGTLSVFDDEAPTSIQNGTAPFAGGQSPEGRLSALDGKQSAGAWTLLVTDDTMVDYGTLYCFEVRVQLDTGDAIEVTSPADVVDGTDGQTSLREAFDLAAADNKPTTIVLGEGQTYRLSCGGPGEEDANRDGDLDLRQPTERLTIEGNGSTIMPDGCSDERVLEVAGDRISVRALTLRGGRGSGPGGALYIAAATSAELDRVEVTDTVTTNVPMCPTLCTASGAVVLEGGENLIANSSIRSNRSDSTGCINVCRSVAGLVVQGSKSMTITGSRFAGNEAAVDPACIRRCAAVGAMSIRADTIVVEQSAVIQNSAVADCELCQVAGGADLYAQRSTIRNTTVADNVAESVDIAVGGVLREAGLLELVASTVVDNTGTTPNLHLVEVEPITIDGTAIGAASGPSGCSIGAAPVTARYSFESTRDCKFLGGAGSIADGGDPRLAPSSEDSPWRAPFADSPVIDAVPTAACTVTHDQVGAARPRGPGCDIGSIESSMVVSRFVPMAPARLFDTRASEAAPGPKGFVDAGETIDIQVTGVAGVPAHGVSAVVLNVTATDSAGAGYTTVWPAGGPRPLASSLNVTMAGQTRANLVTVPLSAEGRVSLFSQAGSNLLADVAGYYEEVNTPQSDGRLVPLHPARVFDSRSDEPGPGPKGLVPAGQSVSVQIAGIGGVPTVGVAAVVLNVTATGAAGPGYITAWPSGADRPLASIVNLNGPGESAPNLVMLPLGEGGSIDLYSSAGAHMLADVTGYVTDSTSAPSSSGLFVPLSPARLFDTRLDGVGGGPKGVVGPNGSIDTDAAGEVGIAADASAAVLNLTATDAQSAGYVTSWPSGEPRPVASSLNVVAGDTRPNAAILPVGSDGRISHYAQNALYLLADVAGYFTV